MSLCLLLLARIALLLPFAPAFALAGDAGADMGFQPAFRPTLAIPRAAGTIRIDGSLDDPGWAGAARAAGFSETDPGDNVEPPVDTEVWVAYDDEALYFAYLAKDDPAEVRAGLHDRDAIWADDYIGIILDTFGAGAWAYELFVNPLGIQGDLRWMSNGEEDLQFDIVWRSMGRVTPEGFQVEVAVPFRSLRFPEQVSQSWRATFWRNRPRESRCRYSWAAIDRDEPCWACNFGTLTGIDEVRQAGTIELLPSLVAREGRELRDPENAASGLDAAEGDVEASLGARWAPSSSLSLEATANPDFSQVESDATEIDVNSTFAIFYPEKRPFFQEGQDLFETYVPGVYTRTIHDPIFAARATNRAARSSFAWIGARDREAPLVVPFEEQSSMLWTDESISNIARYRRSLGEESFVGALLTHRRWDDESYGALASLDGSFRFFHNYRFSFQGAGSRTAEPHDTLASAGLEGLTFDDGRRTAILDGERYDGRSLYASVGRDARLWNANFTLSENSPTFRVANGSLGRNDIRQIEFWNGLFFRPTGKVVQRVTPSVDIARVWNFRNVRKDEWLVPELELGLVGQTTVSVSGVWSSERFGGIVFDGIRRAELNVETQYSAAIQGGLEFRKGRTIARFTDPPVLGRSTDLELWASVRPSGRILIEPSYAWSRMRDPGDTATLFDGYLLRTRASYQFTRRAFLRLVVEYDRFDDALALEPLLTYKVNPFTMFYVGWTERYADLRKEGDPLHTRQQIFLKLQYLVQP
ncbi:MAG: DUF5916 domain-containing protein [Candidatus Eisenbacteria bacterium]